ncbi:hypothetical protein AU254_20870 [Yersinia pestis]|nr:hypothetical protein AU254_20870 [Yersinia pestis]
MAFLWMNLFRPLSAWGGDSGPSIIFPELSLPYWPISELKAQERAGQFMAAGPGLLVYADLTAEGDFS